MNAPRVICLFFLLLSMRQSAWSQVNFQTLLREMANRSQLAQFPEPFYQSLQASSYNRASVTKDSAGWFADSDGIGFIRKEAMNGQEEWVVMEHEGAGVITKMWAPYFYYGGLDDLEGPLINIYLDGNATPVISENYFKLITGRGSVPPPFAAKTARAGDCYLPIPFAKSCKITFNKKPFYNIINYRAYVAGTMVETFTIEQLRSSLPVMDEVSRSLHAAYITEEGLTAVNKKGLLEPGKTLQLDINQMGAVRQLEIRFDPQQFLDHPALLRSIVLTAVFDGEETVWVPLGDFFGSANALNPFQTFTRTVNALGQMVCTWEMPFKSTASFRLVNLSTTTIDIEKFEIKTGDWKWDERSMHFHAGWRSDEILPGNIFRDWNFVDIKGKGVLVGDAITALNPDEGWWGEGDEKIYIDGDWDKKFPTHFGTGTEDYYGWAGGENPGKDDVFSHPYLANILVGSATKPRQGAKGFNICTRVRVLDAIPFNNRLVFDMEASPGTQIRNPWDFLGYSAVVFWYTIPGATSNRTAIPADAAKSLITLPHLDSLSALIKQQQGNVPGAIESQVAGTTFSSDKISAHAERTPKDLQTNQWNRSDHLLLVAKAAGESVSFRLTEQFKKSTIAVQLTRDKTYGKVQLYVNGMKAGGPIDLSATAFTQPFLIQLGAYIPVNNEFVIKLELMGKGKPATALKAGIDYFKITPE